MSTGGNQPIGNMNPPVKKGSSWLPALGCLSIIALMIGGVLLWRHYYPPKPPPEPSKLEKSLSTETDDIDSVEIRLQVRQKVIEYLNKVSPDYQIKGISLSPYRGNIYVIGVDAISDKGRKTFDLIARLYVPENGESYWKIEALTKARARVLSDRKSEDDTDKQDYEPPDEP